jgi:type II secretory pathway component PulF
MQKEVLKFREKLLGGEGAAAALEDFPHVSQEIICLVKVGESTAELDRSFLEISRYFEEKIRLQSKIWRALSYPLFILAAGIFSFLAIIIFLLPGFTGLFASSGIKIPALTGFFINLGVFLRTYGAGLILLAGVLAWVCRVALSRPRSRRVLQIWVLQLPYLSTVVSCYLHLRIVKILRTLLASQVPALSALHYVKSAAPNPVFGQAFSCIINQVESGQSLAQAAAGHRIFSPLFLEALQVGEETGSLPLILKGLEQVFEDELDGQLKKFTLFLEPAATIAVGAFVALIAISMLYPMTELMNGIK